MSNTKNDEVMQELTAEDIAQISGGTAVDQLLALHLATQAQANAKINSGTVDDSIIPNK